MKKVFIFLIIVLVVTSCSPKVYPDQYWGGQRWVLIEMRGVPVQLSGTRRDAYLEFFSSEKRFSGNGGCNSLSGNYTIDKRNELRFGEVTSTKMSCPDIAFETTFIETLNKINRYEVTGNRMLLKDGNEVLLIFQGR